MFLGASSSLFLLVAPLILARDFGDSHFESGRALPRRWYHDDSHPSHALFKRGADTTDYAEVGSPTWQAAYPTATPDSSQLPQAWVNALNAAVDAGLIPDIPPTTNPSGSQPIYADGYSAGDPSVCSSYAKCRSSGDVWDAPDGYFGTGFDDGPYDGSPMLYPFLQKNNIQSTHFMIGMYILYSPAMFLQAFENLQADIAVHTYTHPYMTTLSNLDVVAQLGWTMEIIHNSTGGRVPRYWRPPYGDADNRVRAIGEEVFGLTPIFWNQDTEDWSLTTGGTTAQKINASFTQWLEGPKSPGLIVLEHELSNQSVQAFIDAYYAIESTGWTMDSVATLADNIMTNSDDGVYQNSDSDSGSVTQQGVILDAGDDSTSTVISSATSSSSTSTVSSKLQSTTSTSGAPASSSGSISQSSHNSAASSAVSIRWLWSAIAMALLGVAT